MRHPNKHTKKHGLTSTLSSNANIYELESGYSAFTDNGPSEPLPEAPQHQQLRAHGGDGHQRTVLEVHTNRDGSLVLLQGPVLRGDEQDMVEEVVRLVHAHNQNHTGETSRTRLLNSMDLSSRAQTDDTPSGRKNPDGSVRQHNLTAVLPNRNKRSHTTVSAAALKRRKPSLISLSGLSTDGSERSTPAADVDTPDNSDDDHGEEVLETDQFDTLRADDVQGLAEYYTRGICQIGQNLLKRILKAWIRAKQPKKQSNYPYNGGKNKGQEKIQKEENPGRLTAPDWWCRQEDHEVGRGCRHKEPDHQKKPERIFFTLHMLRLTSSNSDFTVARMRGSTKRMEMRSDQKEMLHQIYDVREKEQAFEEDRIDGGTMIPVFKPKPQPARKRKRAPRNTKEASGVKREARGCGKSMELPTRALAVSTMGSACSSISPLTTAKSEPSCITPDVDFPGIVQTQYASTNDGVLFESAMPHPTVDFGTMDVPSMPFNPIQDDFAQEAVPFMREHPPMEAPITCHARGRGHARWRRGGLYIGRSTSQCKQDSPSHQNGPIPKTVGYDVYDDMYFALRPVRTSEGYPIGPLAFGLNDPRNHAHGGRSPEEQEQICKSHDCPLYRTSKQHQQGILRNAWQSMPFNNHYTEIPQPHGLDAGAFDELMRTDSPNSEFIRSFHS